MRDEDITARISVLEKQVTQLSSRQPYIIDAMALKLNENVGWDINSTLPTLTVHKYKITFTYSDYKNAYSQLFVNLDDFSYWRITIEDQFYLNASDDTKRIWEVSFINMDTSTPKTLKVHFKVISASVGTIGVLKI